MTFRKWIENFWYYYKWLFLTACVFVLFIAICVVQFATKSDPDLSVLYVGPKALSESDCEGIISLTESIIQDCNGDGKTSVAFQSVTYAPLTANLTEGQNEKAKEIVRRIQNEMLAGDAQILLVDSSIFNDLASAGALYNLYAVFSTPPAGLVDDYGIVLSTTRLYHTREFSVFSGDTLLCIRAQSADFTKDQNDLSGTIENFRALLDIPL